MPREIARAELECLERRLRREDDVVLAYLFGSCAKGAAGRLSDVDIAVLLHGDRKDPRGLFHRHLQILGTLSACVDGTIDLVLLNKAPPLLAHEVVRHGQVLYARSQEEERAFVVHARKLYFDFKPRLDLHNRAALHRIREVGLGRGRRSDSGALEAARRIHSALEGTE